MIKIDELTKKYGSALAVDNLQLEVGAGELFGFLGPNGAGKSTTIRMLTCLLRPTSGTASVAGHDILRDPIGVKRSIGYLAEEPFVYNKLTGREFLAFVADLYGVRADFKEERIEALLSLFEMKDDGDQLIESYSHGMRQKIGICSVLVHEPPVILLDEPTNGLDPKSARLVKDILRGLTDRGRTVFMSTHVLEIAERMCSRVGIIKDGKLIAVGSIEDLRGQAKSPESTLEDLFLQLTGGVEYRELAEYLGDR